MPAAPHRIAELSHRLRTGDFEPKPYRQVQIPKKKGGHRTLTIPSLEDRIVQTALAQVLSPVLDPQFEDSSYAYRPGRSVKQAVRAVERWRDAGFWHVIEADIFNFFDEVRHDLLLQKLEVALKDQVGAVEICDLVAYLLEHQASECGRIGKGIAQGSPLSPLLANLYLDALDEALEGKGVRLVRFADDFVILCKKRDTAEEALTLAEDTLRAHGLELHSEDTRVIDFDKGFGYLGHLFVRTFALPSDTDLQEDAAALLRAVAGEDEALVKAKEAEKGDQRAGYDRGARVLYLTEPGRKLSLRNLSFAVTQENGRELAVIAHHRVNRIEIGPRCSIEPEVLRHCIGTDTELVFVGSDGAPQGYLSTPQTGPPTLHLAQVRAVDDPDFGTALAKSLVNARLRNQRAQLARLNRRQQRGDVKDTLRNMGRHLRKLPQMQTVAQLRGLEGAVSALYWPAFGRLTKDAPSPFRRKRPAPDPVNASLNYLLSLLERDIRSAILSAGLLPGVGYLHAPQDRGDALVFDLMEPFRAPLVEGLVAYLFNAGRLRAEMFTPLKGGGIHIRKAARSTLIPAYETSLAKQVKVTGRSYKLAWRPLMKRQAQDLARALRKGEPALFQPYLVEV